MRRNKETIMQLFHFKLKESLFEKILNHTVTALYGITIFMWTFVSVGLHFARNYVQIFAIPAKWFYSKYITSLLMSISMNVSMTVLSYEFVRIQLCASNINNYYQAFAGLRLIAI